MDQTDINSELYAAEAAESRRRVLADLDETDPAEEDVAYVIAKNIIRKEEDKDEASANSKPQR